MNGSFGIGRIFGLPLRAHWSVPVLVLLIGYGLDRRTLPQWTPGRSPAVYTAASVIGAALLVVSLVLHEAAHAVAARRRGVRVRDMTLWAMGGATRMDRPGTAPAALAVALAGPLTSLGLGGAALAAGAGLHAAAGWALPSALLVWLGWANLTLGVFNLLPAVPLDGGRVLQAVLWRRTGDRERAELTAGRGGQVAGVLMVAVGWAALLTGYSGGLWLSFVGLFVALAAGAERQRAALLAALRGVRVADAMSSPVATAPDWLTVERFMSEVAPHTAHPVLPLLDFEGRPSGVLQARRITALPRAQWPGLRLRDVAEPVSQVTLAAPEEYLDGVLDRVRTTAGMRILAVDGGRVVGIVTPGDLRRLLQRHRAGGNRGFPAGHLPR